MVGCCRCCCCCFYLYYWMLFSWDFNRFCRCLSIHINISMLYIPKRSNAIYPLKSKSISTQIKVEKYINHVFINKLNWLCVEIEIKYSFIDTQYEHVYSLSNSYSRKEEKKRRRKEFIWISCKMKINVNFKLSSD